MSLHTLQLLSHSKGICRLLKIYSILPANLKTIKQKRRFRFGIGTGYQEMLLSLPLSSFFTKTTDVIPMGSKKEIKDPRSKEPQAAKDSGAAETRKEKQRPGKEGMGRLSPLLA